MAQVVAFPTVSIWDLGSLRAFLLEIIYPQPPEFRSGLLALHHTNTYTPHLFGKQTTNSIINNKQHRRSLANTHLPTIVSPQLRFHPFLTNNPL